MTDSAGAPGTAAWLEALLRTALGPDAVLGAISFAGRSLHLDGARLPLGPQATLDVAHLAIELGAGLPVGALPLSARVAALRGELHAGKLTVPIDFAADEGDEPAWAHGTLSLGEPIRVEAMLSVRPSGWSLRGDRIEAHGALFPASLGGLVLDRLPIALFPELPADLEVTGSVRPGDGGGLAANLTLGTARSRLSIAGAADASRLRGARLTGRLATADVLGLVPAAATRVDAILDIDLPGDGPLDGATVRGRVFAAEILVGREGAAPLRLDEVSLAVEADARGLRYQDLRGAALGARFAGWGRIPFAPPSGEAASVPLLALQIERAGAALLAEIAAIMGARVPLARPGVPGLPPDLEITGELMVSPKGAVAGSFALETPRSALLFHLTVGEDRALLGSRLRGRFAAADAVAVGLARSPVRPRPSDVFRLDAHLSGTLARPGITGRMEAKRVSVEIGGAVIEVEDASVLLDLGPDGLAWQKLAGRLYGGSFTSSGRLGLRTGTLLATIAWSDVDVGAVPAGSSGEPGLASVLRGACSGEVRFERESLAPHALAARGRIEVAQPVYLFVKAAASTLARYGLPPVRARGVGPLAATVRLERGDVVIEPVSAALDGIDVDGAIRVGEGARVLGRIRVRLREAYLRRSALLATFAAFSGEVTVPVYLRGTPGAMEVQTDALEIVGGVLSGSRVGEAVKNALDGLTSAARKRR